MPPTAEQKRKTATLIDAIDVEDMQDEALVLIADPTVDINNHLDENNRELLFPLAAAAQYGDGPIIDALLARPDIDVNKATSDGMTALMVAAQDNHDALVEKFLNSGKPFNINAVDRDKKTALDYAYDGARGEAGPNKWRTVNVLQRKGAKRGKDIPAVAPPAAAGQGAPVVPPAAAAGPTPEKSDEVNDALMKTRGGSFPVEKMVEMIQTLPPGQINTPGTKNEGLPQNPRFMTPLSYLFDRVGGSDIRVYKAFFDRADFDPNAGLERSGITPLMVAIISGNAEVANVLLAHPRIDVNKVATSPRNETALDKVEQMLNEVPRDKRAAFRDIMMILHIMGAKRFKDLPLATASLPTETVKGVQPMWQGYSESDLSLVNSMFDVDQPGKTFTSIQREEMVQKKIQNFSMCPVCLRYVIRSDACIFMTHECSAPYHKQLYDRYKYMSNGKAYIEWCTICGRICKAHKHFRVGKATGPIPEFTTKQAITDVAAFGVDCKKLGGGGMEEKFMRIQRMIDTVCLLQTKVGKILEQEARNFLTEKIWDSALEEPDPVFLVEVIEGKKFRLEEECKAILTKAVAEKETTYADVERPADEKALTPVKYDGVSNIQYSAATIALREKANAISASSSQKEPAEATAKAAEDAEKLNYCSVELDVHEDNRPTYGFRHKQPDGKILDHGMVQDDGVFVERICGEHLEETLRNLNVQDTKGACPLSDNCKSKLYPEEMQGIVSEDYYNTYKRLFNEVNAGKKGGAAAPSIFGELTDVEGICPLPQKAGKKRRTRRAKKTRKTRKA